MSTPSCSYDLSHHRFALLSARNVLPPTSLPSTSRPSTARSSARLSARSRDLLERKIDPIVLASGDLEMQVSPKHEELCDLPLDPVFLLEELARKQFTLDAVRRSLENVSLLAAADRIELDRVKKTAAAERRMNVELRGQVVGLKKTNLSLQKKIVEMRSKGPS